MALLKSGILQFFAISQTAAYLHTILAFRCFKLLWNFWIIVLFMFCCLILTICTFAASFASDSAVSADAACADNFYTNSPINFAAFTALVNFAQGRFFVLLQLKNRGSGASGSVCSPARGPIR